MGLFVSSDPPFNWCHLKLTRAREHMDSLKQKISAWIETDPCHLVSECNADATRYSVILHLTNPPQLEDWALIAADCFHNFRTALDQFIYAVAVFQSKTDPPPDERLLQFPLCDTPDSFADNREQRRIRSLSAPVRAAIERVQPYKRKHPELPPLLSLLRDFDDTDKHRLLQVALPRPLGGQFEDLSGLPKGQRVIMAFNTGGVKDGTEVAALILDRPTPNVRYKAFRLDMRVQISHAPGPQGLTQAGLEGLMAFISTEVDAVMLEIYTAL